MEWLESLEWWQFLLVALAYGALVGLIARLVIGRAKLTGTATAVFTLGVDGRVRFTVEDGKGKVIGIGPSRGAANRAEAEAQAQRLAALNLIMRGGVALSEALKKRNAKQRAGA